MLFDDEKIKLKKVHFKPQERCVMLLPLPPSLVVTCGAVVLRWSGGEMMDELVLRLERQTTSRGGREAATERCSGCVCVVAAVVVVGDDV